jgi:putative pyruvate formate lyase activating enzyme
MAAAYRERLSLKELRDRADELHALLQECVVCPRECGVHRTGGRYGVCRSTDEVVISSAGPHYGEEPPLVGSYGSGTIFFTSCTLKCVFCQNSDISQIRMGHPVTIDRLAERMLSLQALGCHNINLVTPTHFSPQIVEALVIACERGLSVPLVYNCGGYESVRTLRLLEDIIDIYMPDIKYSNDEHARQYSGAKDYWEVARKAVAEMYRQVGNLECSAMGIARRGLLIRHLVLPNGTAGSRAVLEFVARELSPDTYINIMDQYHPSYRSRDIPGLSRCITSKEFSEVTGYARMLGLHRGFEAEERFTANSFSPL